MYGPDLSSLHDPDRLAALRASGLLDTGPEESFDRLARLAARVLRAPLAMISLVDDRRQFIKSAAGLEEPWASRREIGLDHSVCKNVVTGGKPLVLSDVRLDPAFRADPVLRQLGIVAYAGIPIQGHQHTLGAFCLADSLPRTWRREEVEVLEEISATAAAQIQQRREHGARAPSSSPQERRFRELIEHSSVGTCLVEGDRITYANPKWFEILGYAPGDAAVLPDPLDLVAEEDRERLTEIVRLRHRGLLDEARSEFTALRADGTRVYLESHWTAIGDGDALLGTILDVSQRREAEAALRQSEERYRLVARATNEVIWDLDVSTGRTTWSELGARTFRFAPGELGSEIRWHYDHVHPADRERVVRGIQAAIDGTEHAWSDEYRFLRGDGSYATVLDRGFVVRDERRVPVRMIGSMMDITERKRAEESQRFLARVSATMDASLDYEATLVNIARAAVPDLADYCLIDELAEDGGLRRVATAHVDPERESMLLRAERVAPDADLDRHPVLRVVRTGSPVLVPVFDEAEQDRIGLSEAHRAGLRTLGLCSYIVLPLNTRGRTLGAMTLAAAESGRRYTAADLVLAEELARRAAQAMDNARLYREARAAVRAREEVLAVVSHDLRNPLGSITLGASLLLEMGPEWRRDDTDTPQRILRAASRMEVLIRDLLDASKMDSGHFVVEPSSQNSGELVREAVEAARPAAAEANIVLEADLPDDLPPVHADGDRVLQVFSNLIGNALKFTPEDGTVTVAAEPEGGTVRFSVSDTGPGIAPEQLLHLFDRFWQGRSADRRGAGLGLAIARGIVEAHGGQIRAESKPGEGSTFVFTLPRARTEPSGDAQEAAS